MRIDTFAQIGDTETAFSSIWLSRYLSELSLQRSSSRFTTQKARYRIRYLEI